VTSNQNQKCSFHFDFGISPAIHLLIANIFLDCHHAKFQVLLISFVCNKPKNPKWLNDNLQQLRQNLFSYGKVYTKYPKDPAVKKSFLQII
jgi:hypothetical protein